MSAQARRTRPVGTPVTGPRSGQCEGPEGRFGAVEDSVLTPPSAGTACSCGVCRAALSPRTPSVWTGEAGGGSAPARAASTVSGGRASSVSVARASSIIPSKRPRTETPRRAASASTQGATIVVEADANNGGLGRRHGQLTLTASVYISGAEWWQRGGHPTPGTAGWRAQRQSRRSPIVEPVIGGEGRDRSIDRALGTARRATAPLRDRMCQLRRPRSASGRGRKGAQPSQNHHRRSRERAAGGGRRAAGGGRRAAGRRAAMGYLRDYPLIGC